MTWKELLAQKRVERVPVAHDEINALLELSSRALEDAKIVSSQRKADTTARTTLANVVVRTCGYRVKAIGGGHYNTFRALEAADAERFGTLAVYLDVCRRKRNELSYETFGFVTETEVNELIDQTSRFRQIVTSWMKSRTPRPG